MTWRLDESLLLILSALGPVWFVVAIATLLYFTVCHMQQAFVGAVFILVATQMWWGPLYYISRMLRWWVLGIVLVRGVVFLAGSKRPQGESRAVHRVLGLLCVVAVTSALWAGNGLYTAALAVSFTMGIVLTFGILWRLLDDVNLLGTFARGVVALSLLVFGTGFVVAGLAELFDSGTFLKATGRLEADRYQGVFLNPNMAGILGTILLPIVLASPREQLGKLAKVRWIAAGFLIATIYLSGSRSAVLGGLFAVVILGLYRYGAGAIVTIAMCSVCVGAVVIYAPLESIDDTAVGHLTRTEKLYDLSGRVQLWEEGWDVAKESLLVGHGWGKSRVLDGGEEAALIRGGVERGSNLHNAHLQLLVDLGIVGVALWWTFCAMVIAAGWRLLRGPRNPHTALTVVIFASTMAMLADTMAHGWVFSMGGPSAIVFWGFCAMVLKEVDRIRRARIDAAYEVRVNLIEAQQSPPVQAGTP